MSDDLILPVLLLIVVLIGAVVALIVDSRNKRLGGRVEALRPAGPLPSSGQERSIRVANQQESALVRFLVRLLRIPRDLPKANVISPRVVIALGIVVAIVAASALQRYVALGLAIPASLLLGVLVSRAIFSWEWGTYQKALLAQLPDAVEMVASAVRAGLPVGDGFLSVALEMPSPTKDEFARVANEMALGTSADQALLNVHNRTKVTEYAIFAVTVSVQTRSGGRLVESVQKLAETVRYRLAMGQRAQALAGEARMSAIILGSLPFVAGAGLSLLRPGYLDPLFHDPRGTPLLFIAAIGLVLGVLTMRALIRKATAE